MTRRILAATVLVAALAVATPAQGAVDLDNFNPPPPDWYTCKATGSGAVCHGSHVGGHQGGEDGSCPQGFDILDDAFVLETAKRVHRAFIAGQPGFCGGYHLHDPATGCALSLTMWKDEQALATAERAQRDPSGPADGRISRETKPSVRIVHVAAVF